MTFILLKYINTLVVMRYCLIFIFTLFFITAVEAHSYYVKGSVVDVNNFPIAFCNIDLFDAEYAPISNETTDENGAFSISLASNSYRIVINLLGFISDTIKVNNLVSNKDLGTIILKEELSKLETLHFVGQKSAMEFKIDKRVYNVDADLNNRGTTASDVLENIPSVTVDADGKVSLRGNQNVRILIDGKYSGFASSAEALKTLQSDKIEKVEIITNASSRYDAEGDAGIINIILKRNKEYGFTGNSNFRLGYLPEAGVSLALNYKKNHFNTTFQYNINKDQTIGKSSTYQRVYDKDTSFAYKQLYKHDRRKFRNDFTLGVDYDVSTNAIIYITTNGRLGLGKNTYDRSYVNLSQSDYVISTDNRVEYNKEHELLRELTLGYKQKLNKSGGTWNTEAKIFADSDMEDSDYDEINDVLLVHKIERSAVDVKENYYLLQSDFTYPYSENGNVDVGIRGQWKSISNDYKYANKVAENWIPFVDFTDAFEYEENIYAAYILGSRTYNEWSAQAGVRVEYTDIATHQKSEQNKRNRNLFDLFPSVALSNKPNDKTTLQVTYSKRIRRPGQWDLMPYMKFGDNRERYLGNPNITPEYTHSFELSGIHYIDNGSVLGSLYYKKTLDKIDRLAIVENDGMVYRLAMNVAERDAMGAEFNLTYNLRSWLKINSGFNFYKEIIRGSYMEYDFDVDNFSWTNRSSLNINLKQDFKVQFSSNYQAPALRPQGKTLAIFFGDIAISKDIMKKKGTFGINIRDVLNSRINKTITETEYVYSYSDYQWRIRSAKLTFTYRFNHGGKINSPRLNSIPYDGEMG